jgi:hypothetical protein
MRYILLVIIRMDETILLELYLEVVAVGRCGQDLQNLPHTRNPAPWNTGFPIFIAGTGSNSWFLKKPGTRPA